MFDIINIGTSGLLNHAKGLRVVGNNLANVNTPGFKSSQLEFANLFDQSGSHTSGFDGSGNQIRTGTGLASTGSTINFRVGLDQGTGNPLDMEIGGNGFYAIKRGDELLYTRAGDFHFDAKGVLVNSQGDHVQALDGAKLSDLTLDGLARNDPKATSTVTFSGNLMAPTIPPPATPPADFPLAGIPVIDPAGVSQPIDLAFHDNGGGNYTVNITNAAKAVVGTGDIKFASGSPVPGFDKVVFAYTVGSQPPFNVTLDFSKGVTWFGGANTLNIVTQDGFAVGVKTDQTIGADGVVTVKYSNGQTAKGPRLAMADFLAVDALTEAGGAAFRKEKTAQVQYGFAGTDSFGSLVSGHREGSNVDLAEEFGNLILMQRGYQASSHVISTANDMIQQLFDMKGNR